MPLFAIIQEHYERLPTDLLAPIIGQVTGMVAYDAVRAARDGRGILAESLQSDKAETMRELLAARDVAVRVIPQEDVVLIDPPRAVRQIDISDAALGVVWGYSGPAEPVAWDRIFLVSAGAVVEIEETRQAPAKRKKRMFNKLMANVMDLAVFPGAGSLIRQKDDKRKPGPAVTRRRELALHLADIFASAENGGYIHLRLRSRDLYYENILGAQTKHVFQEDFKQVLRLLLPHAKAARISPETHTLIMDEHALTADPSEADFGAEIEFTQYNRWMVQMLSLDSKI
jgi:hypothetical protein